MMFTPLQLTEIAYAISERFEKVNTKYIKLMSQQIKEIGKLNPSNVHRLEQLIIMGQNIEEINKELSLQTGLALNEIYKLYEESGLRQYKDLTYIYTAQGIKQIPFYENKHIIEYVESVKELTRNTFINMASTTSMQQEYRELVDYAVTEMSLGTEDYEKAVRDILKEKAESGMRVKYASGSTRRLDSACRMNVMEGVRQTNYGVRKQAGKEYGADGVEISAHALCASDHIDYQGKQYSIKEYNAINESLSRHFGTCNCKHTISYIVMGVNKPAYTEEQLKQYQEYSEAKIEINGKEVTRYQASQAMRNLETKMRYKKDDIIALRNAGFDYSSEQAELRDIQAKYRQVSKASGLQKRYERAYVPGYKGKQSKPKVSI